MRLPRSDQAEIAGIARIRMAGLSGAHTIVVALLLLLFPAVAAGLPAASAATCAHWPNWTQFTKHFVQQDGRVIDFKTNDGVSTSEGQAYALFFALVANDRPHFETILRWTDTQLADGKLGNQLPAWQWGKKREGDWGVLDTTPAADADMWLAYTLLEAGRLWQMPGYRALGLKLLDRIEQLEVATLPGFGTLVLPGPRWSALSGQRWRINPSYLPLMLLRAFEVAHPDGPWRVIAIKTVSLLRQVSPHGFAPDWATYHADGGWRPDVDKGATGSYDAIRVYLWAGMLHPADPARPALLRAVSGMGRLLRAEGAMPPERINTQAANGTMIEESGMSPGPIGFSAAMLPYLTASGERKALETQLRRLAARPPTAAPPLHYFDHALMLFGQGWIDRRFAFSPRGGLIPRWATHPDASRPGDACL